MSKSAPANASDVKAAAEELSTRAHRLVNLLAVVRDAPEHIDCDALLDVVCEYAEATRQHTEALEGLICEKPGTEGGAA